MAFFFFEALYELGKLSLRCRSWDPFAGDRKDGARVRRRAVLFFKMNLRSCLSREQDPSIVPHGEAFALFSRQLLSLLDFPVSIELQSKAEADDAPAVSWGFRPDVLPDDDFFCCVCVAAA
ncbi:MAG: hypothetical protein Q8P82_02570 [bacterium]|nr:hypothetical protein [bacterium]